MTRVSTILDSKGTTVRTVAPDARLADVVRRLAEHRVGALVVSRDGSGVAGIISERDVIRRLATDGAAALDTLVAEAMSVDVVTCGPTTTVDELSGIMTERRIRHIPVVEGDSMVGLVSIGDVVKSRIVDLEVEKRSLESYVSGTGY